MDISNANTMIIYDADKMGLAQLYQLRGRVGRSSRQGYAYLMYEKDKVLSEVAEKRLKAIREFTEFGSGFKIAMRDLEIRGAGNILGSQQHGHMAVIGYDLYVKMLNEAIKKGKGEDIEEEPEEGEARERGGQHCQVGGDEHRVDVGGFAQTEMDIGIVLDLPERVHVVGHARLLAELHDRQHLVVRVIAAQHGLTPLRIDADLAAIVAISREVNHPVFHNQSLRWNRTEIIRRDLHAQFRFRTGVDRHDDGGRRR